MDVMVINLSGNALYKNKRGNNKMRGNLPVILDNRNNNTVLNALQKLLPSLQQVDIATGVFEVGSLLQLEGLW